MPNSSPEPTTRRDVLKSGISAAGLLALADLVHTPAPTAPISQPATFVDGAVCPAKAQKPTVIVLLPFLSEPALAWQEEADFCFRMPGGYLVSSSKERYSDGTVVQAFGPWPLPELGVVSQRVLDGLSLPPVTEAVRHLVRVELRHPESAEVVLGPSPGQPRLMRWLSAVLGPPRVVASTDIWTRHGRW